MLTRSVYRHIFGLLFFATFVGGGSSRAAASETDPCILQASLGGKCEARGEKEAPLDYCRRLATAKKAGNPGYATVHCDSESNFDARYIEPVNRPKTLQFKPLFSNDSPTAIGPEALTGAARYQQMEGEPIARALGTFVKMAYVDALWITDRVSGSNLLERCTPQDANIAALPGEFIDSVIPAFGLIGVEPSLGLRPNSTSLVRLIESTGNQAFIPVYRANLTSSAKPLGELQTPPKPEIRNTVPTDARPVTVEFIPNEKGSWVPGKILAADKISPEVRRAWAIRDASGKIVLIPVLSNTELVKQVSELERAELTRSAAKFKNQHLKPPPSPASLPVEPPRTPDLKITALTPEAAQVEAENTRKEISVIARFRKAEEAGGIGTGNSALEQEFAREFRGIFANHPEVAPSLLAEMTLAEQALFFEAKLAGRRVRVWDKVAVATPKQKPQKTPDQILRGNDLKRLKAHYKSAEIEKIANNENFIALIEKARPEWLIFVAKNAVLREMNNSWIKDKQAVTGMENIYRDLLLKHLRSEHALDGVLLSTYADYKSVRMIFTKDTPEIRTALARAFEAAAFEFEARLEKTEARGLYADRQGLAGHPRLWHTGGIGNGANEGGYSGVAVPNIGMEKADIAARSGRSLSNPKNGVMLQTFSERESFLEERRNIVRTLSGKLDSIDPGSSGIFVNEPTLGNKRVLSQHAVELFRKVEAKDWKSYIRTLQDSFKARFNIDLSEDQLVTLREYTNNVDVFSPGILIKERVIVDLGKATHGLVSVDHAGLGSKNWYETQLAVLRTLDSPISTALVEARKGLVISGHALDQSSAVFANATKDVLGDSMKVDQLYTSGDDGILLPEKTVTQEQKVELIRRLATERDPATYRVTFLPDKYIDTTKDRSGNLVHKTISGNLRSKYIMTAESVEKSVRANLESRTPFAETRNVIIAVDFKPRLRKGGKINLIVGGNLTPKIMENVEAALREVLPDDYEAGDIIPATLARKAD